MFIFFSPDHGLIIMIKRRNNILLQFLRESPRASMQHNRIINLIIYIYRNILLYYVQNAVVETKLEKKSQTVTSE